MVWSACRSPVTKLVRPGAWGGGDVRDVEAPGAERRGMVPRQPLGAFVDIARS
jgi:hypothetical protein